MTDFPILNRTLLDEEQIGLWDRITQGPRGFYCGGPDSKRIPDLYNAYMQFPALGHGLFDIADSLRVKTELNGRFRELMVLITSSELGARVEYDFHIPMARDQGIPDRVIEAIGERRTPEFDDAGDALIYDANMQMLKTATLTDETRDKLIALVGHKGLVQLIATVMLYVVTAYTTNIAKVKLADDFSADQTELNDMWAGRTN